MDLQDPVLVGHFDPDPERAKYRPELLENHKIKIQDFFLLLKIRIMPILWIRIRITYLFYPCRFAVQP